MGNQNHLQPYPYTLKTIGPGDKNNSLTICGYRAFLYMLPPKEALTIERLFCHLVFTFDSGVATADRVIQSIGIVDQVPLLPTSDANYQRRQTLNVQADANRKIDISIDLTHLLKRTNVRYSESGYDSSGPTTGYTMVEVLFPNTISFASTAGVINLWKLDGLFTTEGIR